MALMRRIDLTLLLGIGVLAGCGDESESAGALPAPEATYWQLSEQPVFSVSESSDEPSFQLFQAWSGAILDDETIAVGNHGTKEVIFFDYEGRARKIVGGSGGGPGEFASIRELFVSEAGLGVWDASNRRFSRFSSGGELLGSTSLTETGIGLVTGWLADVGVVTVSGRIPGEPREIRVWDEEGDVVLDLRGPAAPPDDAVSWTVDLGDREVTRRTSLPPGCIAYAGETVVDGAIFALSGGLTVQAIDPGGESWEVYRASSSPHLTDTHVAGVRRMFRDPAQYGDLEMPENVLDAAISRIGNIGDPLPMWFDLRPDPSGRLWLERHTCGSPLDGPKTFDVVDLETGYLATLDVPKDQYLLGVRGRWVLMLRVGELDVEHLELYELQEGSS